MFLKEEYAKEKASFILINTIFYQLCLKDPLLSVIYETSAKYTLLHTKINLCNLKYCKRFYNLVVYLYSDSQ